MPPSPKQRANAGRNKGRQRNGKSMAAVPAAAVAAALPVAVVEPQTITARRPFPAVRVAAAALLGAVLTTAVVTAQTAPPPAPAAVQPAPAKTDGWWTRQWQALVAATTGSAERGRAPAKTGIAPAGSTGGAPGAAPPPAVTSSLPVTRDIVEWDDYTGRFDAVELVEVRTRVSGYLVGVHFKDGQRVKKGDLLATIDPRPFERAVETVNAELAQSRTKVDSTAKDVERGRNLLDRRIIAEKVFDDRANVKREAEAAVKVAEAKLKTAELDLSFTRIIAPIDGVISRNLVSAGNYISNAGAAGQSLLTTIVTQDPMHIYFDVSEASTIKYKRLTTSPLNPAPQAPQVAAAPARIASKGAVPLPAAPAPDTAGIVEIALSDETGFPHKGRLDFTDNRMDPATGTLRMRALVDNKSGLFQSGMFARVRIAGAPKASALLLPDEVIGTDQAARFVYVVGEDAMAARKVVTLGPVVDGLRVIRSGISASDWIVTKGIQRVRAGQKVNAKREPLTQSAASLPAGGPAVPR